VLKHLRQLAVAHRHFLFLSIDVLSE